MQPLKGRVYGIMGNKEHVSRDGGSHSYELKTRKSACLWVIKENYMEKRESKVR